MPAHCGPPASKRVTRSTAARERPTPGNYKHARTKETTLAASAPPDELEGLVQGLAADYASASSWKEFVENFRGQEGDFHPQVKRIPHATAELLDELCVTGARVKMSTPKWKMAQKEADLERGPHKSATAHTALP
jgi:hypothetical protein